MRAFVEDNEENVDKEGVKIHVLSASWASGLGYFIRSLPLGFFNITHSRYPWLLLFPRVVSKAELRHLFTLLGGGTQTEIFSPGCLHPQFVVICILLVLRRMCARLRPQTSAGFNMHIFASNENLCCSSNCCRWNVLKQTPTQTPTSNCFVVILQQELQHVPVAAPFILTARWGTKAVYYIGMGAKVPDMAICCLFLWVSGDNRLLWTQAGPRVPQCESSLAFCPRGQCSDLEPTTDEH